MAMMSWMRRTARYFLVLVVVTFIASLAYFGATQDGGGSPRLARITVQEGGGKTVFSEDISAVAYQRAFRATVEQYRQLFRERFNEDLVRSLRLGEQVVERLVTDQLLRWRARAEGIVVSDEELSEHITRIAAFHDGGRFSRPRYIQVLAQARLTPAGFEEDMRADLLRRTVQAFITDGIKVSEAEVRQHWELRHARVRAAYLLVSPEPFLASVEVTDAEREAYHAAHPAEFTRPERRRVVVATLPRESVPPPTVTDAEVETAYQDRLRDYEQPPRVRAAHILVRVPNVGGSAAEDQAKAKADAALARVRQGADFAQVAREVSEDAATAARGGEIGLVARGELVPQFEEAAFTLKAGELGGPVRTPFGYHVIKVFEVVPGSRKELKDVAATLRATLVAEKQAGLLADKAQAVRQALLGAADFAAEAKRQGLTVREVGPLARTDAIEGIGRVDEATQAVFTLMPSAISDPVRVPPGYAIFRLLETQPAALRPLAEVRAEVTQAVRREKAREAASAKARQVVEAWRKGEDPRTLAKRDNLVFAEPAAFSQAQPLADKDLAAAIGPVALRLVQGAVGDPVGGAKGFYVVKTLTREQPDPAGFAQAREGLERDLLAAKRARAWQAWLATLRDGAPVDVDRTLLPQS